MKRILALLFLPLSLAFAADNPRKSNPFGGLLIAPDQVMKMRDALGLSSAQQKELRDLYTQHRPDYENRTAAVGTAQQALRTALERQPLDETEAAAKFRALLDAERAVKELEFRVLVATRALLTAEQAAKVRTLAATEATSSSPVDREAALKAKLERLKALVGSLERSGKPPRQHEQRIRELERAVKAKDAEKAEPIVDELLRALGDAPSGAAVRDRSAERALHASLSEAMQRKDLAAVESAVQEWRRLLGDTLAEPEQPVQPRRPPASAAELTPAVLPGAFAPMLAEIERVRNWKIGLDPAQFGIFPRGIGSVITGCLAARRAGCNEPERLLAMARESGDFLLWAQEQGGRGNFPMPARRNGEGKVWGIVERALRMAEADGRYAEIVQNGWCVDDRGVGDEGGLQIENAVCALGVLDLYEATHDEKYLRSARAAGDWAVARACVPNWNYNSFSVWLLAELHRVTGDARYLESAKEKMRLGVLPGQLTDGPRTGRWLDPHNASPNYHYILTRSLACLLPRLAAEDPDRAPIERALRRALLAWNPVFPRDGAPNLSSASEALALLQLRLPRHEQLLGDTGVAAAVRTLEQLGTEAIAIGKGPSDPSAWGLLLEAAAKRLKSQAQLGACRSDRRTNQAEGSVLARVTCPHL